MARDEVKALCRAIWRHEDDVIAALACRVDPNAKDRWGNTPLLMAAQYGDLALVSLLVRCGGDIDQQRQHLTPITLAARRKAAEERKLLGPMAWTAAAPNKRPNKRDRRLIHSFRGER